MDIDMWQKVLSKLDFRQKNKNKKEERERNKERKREIRRKLSERSSTFFLVFPVIRPADLEEKCFPTQRVSSRNRK